MTTIFLSSTFEDLKDFRQAVLEGLRQSEYDVVNMENYVAGAQRPWRNVSRTWPKLACTLACLPFDMGMFHPPSIKILEDYP